VAAAGRVLLVSQNGVATLVKAAPNWEIESTLDLDEPVLATPAILDNRIYLRTRGHLYCFGE
jgi:outer membrane protein assembly factor BamB